MLGILSEGLTLGLAPLPAEDSTQEKKGKEVDAVNGSSHSALV